MRQLCHCSVRTSRIEGVATKTFDEVFGQLIAQGWTQDQLFEAVCKQVSAGLPPYPKLLASQFKGELAHALQPWKLSNNNVVALSTEDRGCLDSASHPSQQADPSVQAHAHCCAAGTE